MRTTKSGGLLEAISNIGGIFTPGGLLGPRGGIFIMLATKVDIQELPSRFTELVSLSMAGTEVIVTESNIPRARLVPLSPG